MTIEVHRWAMEGLGSVNTYWIETDDAVIVIDGQRELSKARQVVSDIERTGKPIVAVFLTHPHPDHFGGIGVFAPSGSGIPIHGSRQTRDSIAEDRFGLVAASHAVVKDDFPDEVSLPDVFVADGDRLTIAGVELIVGELGAGEAECMTTLYLPAEKALFCGDAIQDRMTAFLLEGRLDDWLLQLDRIARRWPDVDRLYPGHGAPGTRDELLARQGDYLRTFRTIVAAQSDSPPTDEATERVVRAMEARFPGYEPVAAIPDLLAQNVAPTAKSIAMGDDTAERRR